MKPEEQLQKQGYRLTKPRQALLQVLATYPLTVQEIYRLLQNKGVHIDLASVYRSLELFVNMGIVHAIELGGDKRRYELVDSANHHHHLFCNSCGTIQDITVNEHAFLQEVQAKSTFQVDHHHLEFFGLCNKCK